MLSSSEGFNASELKRIGRLVETHLGSIKEAWHEENGK